jgi:starch synthase (maltosyl-transferring)
MSSFFDTDLSLFNGPARGVVDHVSPNVDGGLLPVKRAEGDLVRVQAHVFADGHDTVRAVLQHRRRGELAWTELPLKELPNDEWEGAFLPQGIGFHEYRIAGWVDHFVFWFTGFGKKQREGQKMDVELLIGANLAREAALRASGADAQRLHDIANALADSFGGTSERVALAQSQTFYELATRHPDRSRETVSQAFPLIVERELALFGAWYEFFPRSWSTVPGRHGTLADAQRLLPEIKRMGFDICYLPPVHPIGRKFRKGRNNALQAAADDVGSPWAIGSDEGGHKSIHPELGTLKDFQDFVWRAGELGLEVALDIAFQCSPDHPYVKEHPQWFNWRPDGTIQYAENPPKKYQDIVPFKVETPDGQAMWQELKSIFEFWIAQGVKDFRVDNPHTKAISFWHWCITEIKAAHPEPSSWPRPSHGPSASTCLAKGGYTQGYTYFTWRNGRDELRAYVEELTQGPAAEFSGPTSGRTRLTSCTSTSSSAGETRRSRAWCWRPRCRPTGASTGRPSNSANTSPIPARRSTTTTRSTRSSAGTGIARATSRA